MSSFIWNSWGASIAGPSHKKKRIPNQDSWIARRYQWGNVLVVSDGLGSKPHSDHGSKSACFAVLEASKTYQNNRQANIVDLLRLIHANWLIKLAPFSPTECSSTCLFAIRIEETITLGRLGDGMIVFCGETENDCFVLMENKQNSFSNYTPSLHNEFNPGDWNTLTMESSRCKAIVMCTDGISDDLLPGKQINFSQELYSSYINLTSEERKKDLRHWLNAWPVPKHSDDKTVACLFKQGEFK
ncbi:MAG: protein phosphatase 2C domain-containing protein [Oligoflexia bacterium]|nr:protein phosphatase 2C domain-containing protein [Oligoflexia bacterium]